MQTIVFEKCKKCGNDVRIYNKKSTYYFGSPHKHCKHCGYEYYDNHAIELADLSKERVRDLRKEYVYYEGNWYVFIIWVIILTLVAMLTSEEFVNRDDVFLILLLVGGGIPFAIKCFIRQRHFWKSIYADSQERVTERKKEI